MEAKDFDEKFEQDESDITDHLDLAKARRAKRGRKRLNAELPERSTTGAMAANIRETLHNLAERMPEDATLEDAIEHLRFLRAVEEGKRAAQRGEFASDEDVRRVFAKYGV